MQVFTVIQGEADTNSTHNGRYWPLSRACKVPCDRHGCGFPLFINCCMKWASRLDHQVSYMYNRSITMQDTRVTTIRYSIPHTKGYYTPQIYQLSHFANITITQSISSIQFNKCICIFRGFASHYFDANKKRSEFKSWHC